MTMDPDVGSSIDDGNFTHLGMQTFEEWESNVIKEKNRKALAEINFNRIDMTLTTKVTKREVGGKVTVLIPDESKESINLMYSGDYLIFNSVLRISSELGQRITLIRNGSNE